MSRVILDEPRFGHLVAWESSRAGLYAWQQKRSLLQHLIADWGARKNSLLELGCGSGYFQDLFRKAGFDVAGLECHPRLWRKARERLGNKAELYYGQADHLPFQDKEFDYSALLTLLPFCSHPEKVLEEAFRVSKKGLLIGALNRHSLFGLHTLCAQRLGRSNGLCRGLTWWSWPEIRGMVRRHGETARVKGRSLLPGPMGTWKHHPLWDQLNGRFYPPALGAILVVRLDMARPHIGTPLLAWAKQPGTIPS